MKSILVKLLVLVAAVMLLFPASKLKVAVVMSTPVASGASATVEAEAAATPYVVTK